MVDDRGNQVSEPLRLGARQCRLHLQLFCTWPASADDFLVFYLDFETSGLNVLEHHIVEIGVLCENLACFSTVVCPQVMSEEVAVHGISNEELKQGPQFVDAFLRMCRFCENLAEVALEEDDSSSDGEALQSLRERPPKILICAHNGMNFDFPFLCRECIRNGIDVGKLGQWRYADSLDIFRAMDSELHGGCVKLQCLLRSLASNVQLHAHRALDDCKAFKSVLENVATALGVSARRLIRPFMVEVDCVMTTTHIGMLAE